MRERNDELLDHVMDLLLEKGFEGVTIRELVQSLGMAKRTVTARFGNKASLCKAALERAIDDWAISTDELKAAETDDFEATLHRIATLLVANYLSPLGMRIARVTNAEACRMPEISTYAYQRCTQPLVSYLADLFRRSHDDGGSFADAEGYALSFLNLIGAPSRILSWGVPMEEAEIERHITLSIRLFLNGLPR